MYMLDGRLHTEIAELTKLHKFTWKYNGDSATRVTQFLPQEDHILKAGAETFQIALMGDLRSESPVNTGNTIQGIVNECGKDGEIDNERALQKQVKNKFTGFMDQNFDTARLGNIDGQYCMDIEADLTKFLFEEAKSFFNKYGVDLPQISDTLYDQYYIFNFW